MLHIIYDILYISRIFSGHISINEKEILQKPGGLGFGLSIAKENVELLVGEISLESKKGEDTIFYVTIS